MPERISNTDKVDMKVRNKKPGFQAANYLINFLWNHFPRLSKILVKRLFFSPARYRASFIEKEFLKSAEKFEQIVNGKKIKCWQWGHGPTILLAHGWNGRGIQLHSFIKPLVDSGYSVLAFDAPGHGKSQGKISSYFEYSDVIRSFFRSGNDLGIAGAVAHSLGASAVISGMAKEGYLLEAVLISPALRLSEILSDMFINYGFPLPILQIVIREFEIQFGYNLKEDNPYNLLSHIESGILVIHDHSDRTIPYNDSLEASSKFRNISLHTTNGLGHKKILFDSTTIDFVISHICNRINIPLSTRHQLL